MEETYHSLGWIYHKHDNTITEQCNRLDRELYSKEYKK